MLPAAPADHSPVFLIGNGGHRAGVDDIAVAGFLEANHLMSHGTKQLLHGLGLVLVHLATKGVKSKFHSHFYQNRYFRFVLIVYSVHCKIAKFCYNGHRCTFFHSVIRRISMHQFSIQICSSRQVKEFVTLAMIQPFEVLVGNEQQMINGKSFIGMFSLDHKRPVCVSVRCSDEEFSRFRQDVEKLLA
jgi:hypothetical protein